MTDAKVPQKPKKRRVCERCGNLKQGSCDAHYIPYTPRKKGKR